MPVQVRVTRGLLIIGTLATLGALGCRETATTSPVLEPARSIAHSSSSQQPKSPSGNVIGTGAAAPSPRVGHRAFDEPFLGSLQAHRTYSIGTASRGYLVHGVAMKESHPCLRTRTSSRQKRAIYGTSELVAALETVACGVQQRWPGSLLYAGDLSARDGGDLRGHASHNSGRDADLAFYMRDSAGRIADSTRMLPIAPSGEARWGGHLFFDLPRNWALVEGLLKNASVQVQYLFVAKHLRKLLLEHARLTGKSTDVIAHASRVLRQPGDSSIHQEHFHLRLYCSLHERLEGCVDYGAVHPWVDGYEAKLSLRVAEVLPFLRAGGVEEVKYAIVRIVRLRAIAATQHLEALRNHADAEVRQLAADAVAFLRGQRTPPAWAHLAHEDPGE